MGVIERKFGIPRSTLSGWFRNIELTEEQKQKIQNNASRIMEKARKKAVIWHNTQKQKRLVEARDKALSTLDRIDLRDRSILELALSFLYFGEGAKINTTSIGNSNPLILKFFVSSLSILYGIDKSKLKCNIHIRSDQDGNKLKRYWSRQLRIPIKNFAEPLVDKRTVKSKTYPSYKGVCVVRTGGIAIQRKLMFLSGEFCDKILTMDD